ncbi:hypothetical protein BDZ97DRAFT_1112814 [Flammula alnicola]|nr:hypothetical protein BDZ97DRAFT_1112814 [Flammula alnicola]
MLSMNLFAYARGSPVFLHLERPKRQHYETCWLGWAVPAKGQTPLERLFFIPRSMIGHLRCLKESLSRVRIGMASSVSKGNISSRSATSSAPDDLFHHSCMLVLFHASKLCSVETTRLWFGCSTGHFLYFPSAIAVIYVPPFHWSLSFRVLLHVKRIFCASNLYPMSCRSGPLISSLSLIVVLSDPRQVFLAVQVPFLIIFASRLRRYLSRYISYFIHSIHHFSNFFPAFSLLLF